MVLLCVGKVLSGFMLRVNAIVCRLVFSTNFYWGYFIYNIDIIAYFIEFVLYFICSLVIQISINYFYKHIIYR